MTATRHAISPEALTSLLTLAAEVFAQWEAGRVVVLDHPDITVDGNLWKQICNTEATDITQQPNTFKLQDGRWTVEFAGKKHQFKDSVGLKYIHLVLARNPISVSQLISTVNCHGSGPGTINAKQHDFEEGGRLEGLTTETDTKRLCLTKDQHRLIRVELPALKRELESLRAAEEFKRAEDLEEKIEKIEQHLKKNSFKGLERPFSSKYKRDLDAVRLAINRAIKSIGTVNPQLAWHFTISIKFGAQCIYRPEKPAPWNL